MEELTINPEKCPKFEPNAFKKEKCKHCQRIWKEHKGVIDPALVQAFVAAAQKKVDEEKRREQGEKDKERAKLLAKKKQAQAVEDEWLFSGDGGLDNDPERGKADTVDSDDDLGFRMFNLEDMQRLGASSAPSTTSKALKVVNLIDFGECDEAPAPVAEPSVPAVLLDPAPTTAAASAEGPSAMQIEHDRPRDDGLRAENEQLRTENEHLRAEIEHLQLMLAHANEEKNIQVAIVKDEVAEKQAAVEDLQRQRSDSELQLAVERARFLTSTARQCEELEAAQATLARLRLELDSLRVDNERLVQREAESRAALESHKDVVEAAKAVPERVPEVEGTLPDSENPPTFAESSSRPVQEVMAPYEEASATMPSPDDTASPPPATSAPATKEATLTVTASQGPPLEEVSLPTCQRVSDLRSLCMRIRVALGDKASSFDDELPSAPRLDPDGVSATRTMRELEEELADIVESAAAALAASERVASDHLRLTHKLRNLERSSTEAQAPKRGDVSADQAALILRNLRLQSESQLAWIRKQSRIASPCSSLTPTVPLLEAVGD